MVRHPKRAWASLALTRLAPGRPRRPEYRSPALWLPGLWLVTFLLYAGTTALDILPADSGEFQLNAAGWGIGHPPGYALYTMVSALWVRLFPIGTVPFRANLLSAALAATTLMVLARCVELWATILGATRRRARGGAALAALSLGAASTFWAQATIANIRMPTMLFVAWGYLALAHYRAAGGARARQRALTELAIAAGLGVGHHPSLAFIAVGWGVYLLWITPDILRRPRTWYRAVIALAAAWLLPQLYLPLRGAMANVPLNPGDLTTWQGFWDHVLARGFGGDMLAYATREDLALRLPLLPTLFRMQFPMLVLVAMVIGWGWLVWRDRATALSLLVAWVVQSFFTITYRAPQTVEYLMPAYVPMALALGLAAATRPVRGPGDRVRAPGRCIWPRAASALTGLVALALLLQLPGHVRDFAVLAGDTSIRDRTEPLLAQAPAGSTLLADWHWATPLWVLQAVEGLGPEAVVTYIYPEEDLDYDEVWRTHVEEDSSPALFTTHTYTWEGWTFAPVGGGYRLYREPLQSLPAELGFTAMDADLGPIRLLGVRWSGNAKPGATIELQLAWQVVASGASAPSFATRLWGAENVLLSSADQSLGTGVGAGESMPSGVNFTTLTHQLPVDRCSPEIYPTVSTYTVTEAGFSDLGSVSLPALQANCDYPTLPTERFWPGVVLGKGPLLRGVDYDVQRDGTTMAYLHWCGPGAPLTLRQGESETQVERLALGECQTVSLRYPSAEALAPALTRADGSAATLVALRWPAPKQDERYLPFGADVILVGASFSESDDAGEPAVLTLRWHTVTPQVNDYAVSVRLQDAEGNWLGMHDMQPGLGAIPTLKWVTRGDLIRDPHSFATTGTRPSQFAVTVYERFRMTPLRSALGDMVTYQLP